MKAPILNLSNTNSELSKLHISLVSKLQALYDNEDIMSGSYNKLKAVEVKVLLEECLQLVK